MLIQNFTDSKTPIPWLTYESIIWILENTQDCKTLFEWGAGASTVFFKQYFDVTTIEHDKKWAKDCIWIDLDSDEYPKAIDRTYDIVLVDGRRRVECVKHAIPFVGKYLILDNSERERYQEAHDAIPDTWIRRDFYGAGRKDPWKLGEHREWQTTIYERR